MSLETELLRAVESGEKALVVSVLQSGGQDGLVTPALMQYACTLGNADIVTLLTAYCTDLDKPGLEVRVYIL